MAIRVMDLLRFVVRSGDPSSPSNGDTWYDSSGTPRLRARINGSNVTLFPQSNPVGVAYAANPYSTLATFGNVTTYTVMTNTVGVVFQAPVSGMVSINWGAADFYANNSIRTFMSYRIRNGNTIGSGTTAVSESDDTSVVKQATTAQSCSRTDVVIGLTSGNFYNIQFYGKMASSTAGSGGNASGQYVCVFPW